MTNDEQLAVLATTDDVSHLIVVCYRRQTDARHALDTRMLQQQAASPPAHTKHTTSCCGNNKKDPTYSRGAGRDLSAVYKAVVSFLFRSKKLATKVRKQRRLISINHLLQEAIR